jgi:hypothetical protein
MNLWAGLGVMVVGAGAVYFFGGQRPGDVFPMPVSEAYAKLSNPSFASAPGKNPYNDKTIVNGNGKDRVIWTNAQRCVIDLKPAPKDADETLVAVNCNGGASLSDGAASGMVHNMMRSRTLEMVDATLTGRVFENGKVGSIAARWPGDGVDGSMGTAMGQALKMSSEMGKMEREMKHDAEMDRFNAPVSRSSSY